MKQKSFEYYQEELNRSKAKLRELQRKGTKALSRYDIKIAHQGDAALALKTAKYFVSNHILYFESIIAELNRKPSQLSMDLK